MVFRLAQISDTHLSPRHPVFDRNHAVVAERLRADRPDLVVHTGDISAHGELGGEAGQAELEHAFARHQEMGLDWLAIPGNHDVGNDPVIAKRDGADAERVGRWNGIFGADRFLRDVPGWRLIGLDTLITATEMAEEQFDFLQDALSGAQGRSIAIFLHKPLCEQALDEAGRSYWHVLEEPRRRMVEMFRAHPPAFVASGHVHQWRDRGLCEGIRQIWAPAVAFHVGDDWADGKPFGEKVQGYVMHALHPDGRHEYELVRPEGIQRHDIGRMPDIYGQLQPAE